MHILKEIYEFTRVNNLADSECDFSRTWLNKSARYYSMLKYTGRQPSFDALVRLSTNLQLRKSGYQKSQVKEIRSLGNSMEELDCRLQNALKARTISEAFALR